MLAGAVVAIAVAVATSLVTSSETTGQLVLEAEDANRSGAFEIGIDITASNGLFVQVPPMARNLRVASALSVVGFCFEVTQSDTFWFEAVVEGPNAGSNSFGVAVDGESPARWDFPTSREFRTRPITEGQARQLERYLAVGEHTLSVHRLESGARLDRVIIHSTSGAEIVDCDGGPAASVPAQVSPGTSTSPTEDSAFGTTSSITDGGSEVTSTTTIAQSGPTTTSSDGSTTTTSSTTTSTTSTTAPPTTTSTTTTTTTTTVPVRTVVWRAGHEKSSLTSEWTYYVNIPGDASATISSDFAHSGSHSAKLTVNGPEKAGTRLKMARAPGYGEKGDKQESLPSDAYYSIWYYLPQHVEHTGWFWNVWQWEHSAITSSGTHTATPLYVINIVNRGSEMRFLLERKVDGNGKPMSNGVKVAESTKAIPVGRWFHLECRYKWSLNHQGIITCWQDGTRIFDESGLVTDADIPFLYDKWEWTVNNYTQNTTPATHSIYVDDAAISLRRLGPG